MTAAAARDDLALAGIRVVECGDGVAAAYAAKLLADLGADVVKVEPPGGDSTRRRGPFPGGEPHRERSGLFLYLNANKRGVVLDLRHSPDRAALDRLLAGCDLLITDLPPRLLAEHGLLWPEIHRRHARVILTSITPFGLDGPHADREATDLTLWAAGGIAYLNGAGPGGEALPPLKAFGQQAAFQGGVHAAVAALGALLGRARLGGEGQHVEVSIQECLASILELTYVFWPYLGLVASRLREKPIHPLEFFECRDGWIYVCCVEEHQWRQLVELMGNPEWADDARFTDRLSRAANWRALKPLLGTWMREQSVRALYEAAQARRVPFAPVSTMKDLLKSDHLAARGFFAEVTHPDAGRLRYPGAPYRLTRTPWRLRSPAPRLGEHTSAVLDEAGVDRAPSPRRQAAPNASSRGPLTGVRVADFTWVWAGPHATLQLAHLGAEVIRVEALQRPCVTRLLPPWPDGQPGPNRSGYYNQYNQGKRSIVVDLKTPEGLEVAHRLVAWADVAAENFSAGVMERLGLGYDALRARNPRLVMIALSGYGATGPEREFVSYGPAQVPLSGMSSLTGYRGFPPMHVGISYGDPNGGIHGTFAVLAALWHRQRTGDGQYIDLSQWETSMAVLAEGIMETVMNGCAPERDGNRDRHMAPHGIFPAAGDDRWVALAIRDDDEWRRLAAFVGPPALADDARFATLAARKENEDALEALVASFTAGRPPEALTALFQGAGLAAAPAMSNRDLFDDPHLRARGFFVELPHPEVGVRRHLGIPWRMSATPCAVTRPAPCLGEATDYVLGEILGYDAATRAELRARGIVA